MDAVKVGNAIKTLREKAGYTQRSLAEHLYVSDKAVSKWERGLGLPDISCLRRLSILLDTDTDSLLAGEAITHGNEWCGVLFLDSPCGMDLPVCDKPVSDYLLSYFLLAGIRQIAVICDEKDRTFMEKRFIDGEKYGICLSYFDREAPLFAQWLEKYENCMLLQAPLFLYGVDMTSSFLRAMMHREQCLCLSLPMGDQPDFPPITFDDHRRAEFAGEKKQNSRYAYHALPLWFCPGSKVELILHNEFPHDLYTEPLNRGYSAILLQSEARRALAAQLVDAIQRSTALYVCDLNEIAKHRGLI